MGHVQPRRSGRLGGDITALLERPLDPIIPRDRKGFSSRMIIDACRPFEWRDKFPPAAQISPERRQAVMEKWKRNCLAE